VGDGVNEVAERLVVLRHRVRAAALHNPLDTRDIEVLLCRRVKLRHGSRRDRLNLVGGGWLRRMSKDLTDRHLRGGGRGEGKALDEEILLKTSAPYTRHNS